jgi:hypothetical protein
MYEHGDGSLDVPLPLNTTSGLRGVLLGADRRWGVHADECAQDVHHRRRVSRGISHNALQGIDRTQPNVDLLVDLAAQAVRPSW